MKYSAFFISILIFLTPLNTYAQDCYDAYSSADDAYTYAKRAYRETDFDSAQYQIRRAKNAADEAMSNADDCGT